MDNNLKIEWANYVDNMLDSYLIINEPTALSDDEIKLSDEFHEMIEEDLLDHGFDEDETYAIINWRLTLTLKYKLLAYLYIITGPFDTIEELKDVIIGSFYSDYKEFTQEDIENIYKQRDKIDAM